MDVKNLINSINEQAAQNSPKKDGDYYDSDGLLHCGVCGGFKETFITMKGANGEPGERIKVHCICKCVEKQMEEEKKREIAKEQMERIRQLRVASLMDDNFSNATFSNFKSNGYNERNLKLCKRYCEVFDKMLAKPQGLLFWGEVGTGKSYAAACIANELLNRKIPVIMTSFVKILEMIQSDRNKENELMYQMRTAKLVILDDLGTERNTAYAIEKVYNIIDTRYRAKLPMILTTNLKLQDMMNEMDIGYKRIYDRILEVCYPMQFTGKSWRREMAKDRFDEMSKMFE